MELVGPTVVAVPPGDKAVMVPSESTLRLFICASRVAICVEYVTGTADSNHGGGEEVSSRTEYMRLVGSPAPVIDAAEAADATDAARSLKTSVGMKVAMSELALVWKK